MDLGHEGAGMGSMRSSINMLGPGLLLKPNILAMGKPKATIFITNLGLVLQPKPKTPIPLTNLFPPPPRLGITLGRSFLLPAGRKAGRLSKWEVTGLARSLARAPPM